MNDSKDEMIEVVSKIFEEIMQDAESASSVGSGTQKASKEQVKLRQDLRSWW